MNKTIKERANKSLAKWDDNIYFHYSELTEDSYKDGYIEGATEQKVIDEAILKAKIVGAKRQGRAEEKEARGKFIEMAKAEVIDKACKWLKGSLPFRLYYGEMTYDVGDFVNDFRKAMEE